MRVYLRLYKRYDRDLLALFYNPYVNFGQMVRESLRGYLEDSTDRIPTLPHFSLSGLEIKSESVNVYISEQDNPEVIAFLLSLEPNCRNSAVKCILRTRLESPCMDLFLRQDVCNNPVSEQDEASPPRIKHRTNRTRTAPHNSAVPLSPIKEETVPAVLLEQKEVPEDSEPDAVPDLFKNAFSMLKNFKGE